MRVEMGQEWSFAAPDARPRRRPSLTPMIDVVFLLLVFFMLASRFGVDAVLPLPVGGGGGAWDGPPRLVEVRAEAVAVNGVEMTDGALAEAVAALVSGPGQPVVLRGAEGVSLQRVVALAAQLREAGLGPLVLVE